MRAEQLFRCFLFFFSFFFFSFFYNMAVYTSDHSKGVALVLSILCVGFVGSESCASNCWSGGRGFDPRRVRQHSFVELDYEIFSMAILSLPLIQEGQFLVHSKKKKKKKKKKKCAQVLVNCYYASPGNVWLGQLKKIDMTLTVLTRSSNQPTSVFMVSHGCSHRDMLSCFVRVWCFIVVFGEFCLTL